MKKRDILKKQGLLSLMLMGIMATLALGFSTYTLSDEDWLPAWHVPMAGDSHGQPMVPHDGLVGVADAIFTPPQISEASEAVGQAPSIASRLQPLTDTQLENLHNFNYLTNRIFLVDPETILLPTDINVYSFLAADLTINTNVTGPQVLIFHTHSGEMFIDSDPAQPMTGVMGTGRYLAEILANTHGIETMHYTGRFDFVDGRSMRPGAYERMEPVIKQILADNPSIQVVIDLHRDGVGAHHGAFVRDINGKETAQIMFFNGLSRHNRGGQGVDIAHLPNPYQFENLNFSFRLQLAANQLYPGLARRVYLRAFRYSLHMLPLSTLVEVGNQFNTRAQANNAMYPLANIIAAVVLQ